MNEEIKKFGSFLNGLRRNAEGGVVASHKPLLLLYILEKVRVSPLMKEISYKDEEASLITFFKEKIDKANIYEPFYRLARDQFFGDFFEFVPLLGNGEHYAKELRESGSRILLKDYFKR